MSAITQSTGSSAPRQHEPLRAEVPAGRAAAARRWSLVAMASLALAAVAGCGKTPGPGAAGAHQAAVAPAFSTAQSFAVLAGQTVTNTGPTVVFGDLGVSPGTAVTGFPPGSVSGGVTHTADAVALQAQSDLTAAYLDIAGRACNFDLTGIDLVGRTLAPGVYCFSSSALLSGALVLDAQGSPDALFVFQVASGLTTASNASVRMINGGETCNVFWQVGSSAVIGTGTTFVGSILALTSISLGTGATVSGRVLARNGEVTLDDNQVSVGSCAGCSGTVCGGACTDTKTDLANCGACGNACGAGQSCTGGVCAGAICTGTMCCSGCTDTRTDLANCGACGNACGVGQSCTAGVCTGAICKGTLCGGACTDTGSDLANCGACGNACGAGQSCTAGVCAGPICALTMCQGACVDPRSDFNNCGACGIVCATGQSCLCGYCANPSAAAAGATSVNVRSCGGA
jgi:hypothetical protein